MDPEKLINALMAELEETLVLMAKVKTLDEKKQYSEIVHNLTESIGVFLKLASDMMDMDYDGDYGEDDYDDDPRPKDMPS
jgi:hypothetical protein